MPADDEPAAPAAEPEKKRRPPFVAIFTFLACCFAMLQFLHEIIEHYDASIEAVLFGLAGG